MSEVMVAGLLGFFPMLDPRVGAALQPWAWLRIPVGEISQKATESLTVIEAASLSKR